MDSELQVIGIVVRHKVSFLIDIGAAFSLLTSSKGPLPEKAMAPTPVLLPGKSHGWRSLVGGSPWGHKGSDTTEQLHFTLLNQLCIEKKRKEVIPTVISTAQMT